MKNHVKLKSEHGTNHSFHYMDIFHFWSYQIINYLFNPILFHVFNTIINKSINERIIGWSFYRIKPKMNFSNFLRLHERSHSTFKLAYSWKLWNISSVFFYTLDIYSSSPIYSSLFLFKFQKISIILAQNILHFHTFLAY